MKVFSTRWVRQLAMAVAVAAILTTIGAAVGVDRARAGSPFGLLNGSWSGWGWVTLHNGGRERVRCKARYSMAASNRINQAIRCASTSYRIDATSSMINRGSRISGSWRESSYDASGSLSGSSNARGLNLRLSGSGFSAGMNVSVKRCKQSVNISLSGLEIRKVTMGLRNRAC